jgi:hypothetical protein
VIAAACPHVGPKRLPDAIGERHTRAEVAALRKSNSCRVPTGGNDGEDRPAEARRRSTGSA